MTPTHAYTPLNARADPPLNIVTRNPLFDTSGQAHADFLPRQGHTTVAWSGWMGEPDVSADGQVPPDHRTWCGPGRIALVAALDRLLPHFLTQSASLWLRPHARHTLSDAPSCAWLLRERAEAVASGTLGLLIDLDLLITPEMVRTRFEHARRLVESLAPVAGVRAWAMTQEDWAGPIGRLFESLAPQAAPLLRA